MSERKTVCRYHMTEEEKKQRVREQIKRSQEKRRSKIEKYNREYYEHRKEMKQLLKISI